MKRLIISSCYVVAMLLYTAIPATAAEPQCSVHPPKGTPDSALPAMTKVDEAAARKTALGAFAAGSAAIAESELEVERGCLVYSFDVRVRGKDGIEEIWVDAGSGQIGGRKHESAEHEAAEAAAEKAEAAAAVKP